MIENEHQYIITLKQLAEFHKAIERIEKSHLPNSQKKMYISAYESQIEDFDQEIAEYEARK